jgi:DNA ligase (NAD+)
MDFTTQPCTSFKDVDTLSKSEARDQVEALRDGIAYHDFLYYVKQQPTISNAVYDRLFRRLQELEAAFPDLQSADSPSRRVGAEPVDKLKRVTHMAPMLSLNATLEAEEVKHFHTRIQRETGKRRVEYVLEPKFDGLSVEVVYDNGRFVYGATRGDGESGDDISANLKTIRALPLRLQDIDTGPSFLAVRGEVFLPRSGFQRLNKTRLERSDEPFVNPRNAAAGIMRQLDASQVADKPLDIVFYDILDIKGPEVASHWEVLECLSRWGLKTDPHNRRASSVETIQDYREGLAAERDDLDYDIDGVVIKLSDHAGRQKLGTRERSPRWALAWKFPPRQEVTTLVDIVVQVGRTGMLTPVALLQPVDVGGVTVSRATLHNEAEVQRKDVRPGDAVHVARAGDVIPEVMERLKRPGKKRGKPFSMPRTCPACGAGVVREGAYVTCPAGLSCPAQLIGHVVHYATREAVNIDHLGDQTATQLVQRGLVRSVADLYQLSVADVEQLDGFAQKSAAQLVEAIQARKQPRLDRFLYALGIRHVGQHTARVVAQHFRRLDAIRQANDTDFEQVPEVGEETARSLAHFFAQEENAQVFERFSRLGVRVRDMPTSRGRVLPLDGKTFVFTGSLAHYARQEASERVQALGGRATSSVSAQTDFVVVGNHPGRKLQEAHEHDVSALGEDAFRGPPARRCTCSARSA